MRKKKGLAEMTKPFFFAKAANYACSFRVLEKTISASRPVLRKNSICAFKTSQLRQLAPTFNL